MTSHSLWCTDKPAETKRNAWIKLKNPETTSRSVTAYRISNCDETSKATLQMKQREILGLSETFGISVVGAPLFVNHSCIIWPGQSEWIAAFTASLLQHGDGYVSDAPNACVTGLFRFEKLSRNLGHIRLHFQIIALGMIGIVPPFSLITSPSIYTSKYTTQNFEFVTTLTHYSVVGHPTSASTKTSTFNKNGGADCHCLQVMDKRSKKLVN